MKRLFLPALAAVAVMLTATVAHAYANSVYASGDTYVERDNSGPYGWDSALLLKNRNDDKVTRKALIRFSMTPSGVTHEPMEAALSFVPTSLGGSSTMHVHVFGITQHSNCDYDFDEPYTTYKTDGLGFLDDSDSGVDEGSWCIWSGADIAMMTITASDLNHRVYLTDPRLQQFIAANSSYGMVTFVLTREEHDDNIASIASRETGWTGPVLQWTDRDDLTFSGGTAPSRTKSGPQTFTGDLKLPLVGGQSITLPGANVTATYSGGHLETFDGTVGMPELPQTGLFQYVGLTGPSLSIGYDYPSAFDPDGTLPLDQSEKFFYLTASAGADLAFGSAGSPIVDLPLADGNSGLLAVDPVTSTFFAEAGSLQIGTFAVSDGRLGVSDGDIPFVPDRDQGISSYVDDVKDADFYLGGAFDLGSKDVGSLTVDAGVDGDTTVAVDTSQLDPQHWVRYLAGNGTISVNVSAGSASFFDYTMADSTLFFEPDDGGSGIPLYAYSGIVKGPSIPDLPYVQFDSNEDVTCDGVIGGRDWQDSFEEYGGDVTFGDKYAHISISGTVTDYVLNGKSFSGKAKFPGFDMAVSGTMTTTRAQFSGTASLKWTPIPNCGVDASLKATFDTGDSNPMPSVKASGSVCGAGAGIDADMKSDGHVELCVDISGSHYCQTF